MAGAAHAVIRLPNVANNAVWKSAGALLVIGVGLPALSVERELIKQYFDNLEDSGFSFAYLYPGMTRVLQAAGRVIRTPDDRGAILLVGSRFSDHAYQALFPAHWSPKRIKDINHLSEVLNSFFGEEG